MSQKYHELGRVVVKRRKELEDTSRVKKIQHKGDTWKKTGPGSVPTGFSGRCPFLSMSFTDRSDAHTEPVGPCLKNDPLVVKLIHPHVTRARTLRSAKPQTVRRQ